MANPFPPSGKHGAMLEKANFHGDSQFTKRA